MNSTITLHSQKLPEPTTLKALQAALTSTEWEVLSGLQVKSF